jgi:lipid-A-disaccharide synthase
MTDSRLLSIHLVAAEESGDLLGAALMRALRQAHPGVRFAGVGGRHMAAEGIVSPFPIEDLSIVGIGVIARKLPLILRRIRETAAAIVAARPDALVIIDSPDYAPRRPQGARRRARDPDLQLCTALDLGVAAVARQGDARLRRRGAGDPAVRAGRLRSLSGTALHVCGSPAGGAARRPAAECR